VLLPEQSFRINKESSHSTKATYSGRGDISRSGSATLALALALTLLALALVAFSFMAFAFTTLASMALIKMLQQLTNEKETKMENAP
jgi:hypothetical protein